MKGKRSLFLVFVFSCLIGWFIGYIRIPDISIERPFWLGFSTCAFIALSLFLIRLLLKNYIQQFKKKNNEKSSIGSLDRFNNISIFNKLGVIIFVLSLMILGFFIIRQNRMIKTISKESNNRILKQSELIKSIRNSNQLILLNSLLSKIDQEIESNPNGNLNQATIARIVAFSHTLNPYSYFENDSLTTKKYSPERAQFLLALINMEIDSLSFIEIKNNTDFSFADLSKADLKFVNLTSAKLRSSNFNEAELYQATFENADLQDASFWGANLDNANLNNSTLIRSDFSWANLNNADMRNSEFGGSTLVSAKMKGANLQSSKIRWTDLEGVLLNGANLSYVDLAGSSMPKAILYKADLSYSDLRYINLENADLSHASLIGADLKFSKLKRANFTNAELDSVIVDIPNWFQQLEEWNVSGVEEIKLQYQIVRDTTQETVYYLQKKI